ncbi:type IV secretion/conjugal transfer ATPase, VirB4 family [Fusobacterium necrophorum subsp. funduliforme ATCC 51357]|nr:MULTISPECIES: conjugal transfer protein TrbE [Fusobacterium]EFS22957.2 type IV secretion/conjugal transfer ATPase, VirB4 family [Fusobacterium necrophorum D12]EIJ68719.1 type IV secretion/conjugal transfer ATPase, VirB4 family [Fusobacterium necrophorum subsp. funduliforme ATCC 51357]KAB0552960.1 conjugal transfer protein TrbE [Fusobacterium necrophorum subsp. funduliforme]
MFQEYKKPKIPKELFVEPDLVAYLMPYVSIDENKNYEVRTTDSLGEERVENFPIVYLKDGSYQTTFQFRGKDLDSCTVYELLSITSRMNNTLKQLNADWTIHVHAIRKKIKKYNKKEGIQNIPIKIIELEREEFFKSGHHYESDYYITFTWLTPTDQLQKAKSLFFKKTDQEVIINFVEEHLKYYNQELTKIYALLSDILQECRILSIDEVVSFYHSLVSDNPELQLKAPRAFYYKGELIATGNLIEKYKETLQQEEIRTELLPVLLDSYLYDSGITGGIEPKIGKYHIRTVSLLKYPGDAIVGILDELNRVNIEYDWCSRYIMMDTLTAKKELEKYFDRWDSARESFKTLLKTSLFKMEGKENDAAASRAWQIRKEKANLEQDYNTVGYYTFTVVLKGENKAEVEKRALLVKTILNAKGFTAKIENFNALEAYLSTMPGNLLNVRKPLQNSLVFGNLLPLNAVWAGDAWNKHLNTPPLLYCQTIGNTPFRLNLHFGDVGHTIIIGPTGAGKSVLLATLHAQFLAYPKAKVIAFDRGASTRVLNKAAGGVFYDLGEDNIRFQPLRYCDQEKEREWCQEWILGLLEENTLTITPDIQTYVWKALTNLAKLPIEKRTMNSFVDLVGGQSRDIKNALQSYYGKGPFAKYFDGNEEFLQESLYTVFEMEKVMEHKNVITPLMEYLFHLIDTKMIDGISPMLLTLDEGWAFLKNKRFSGKIEDWERTLRKKNVSIVFTTQNPDEVLESDIKAAILNQCYTRIFLPNPNAKAEIQAGYYKIFGLNDTEIDILQNSTPKKQYYFKNPKGSRLFELALSPLELCYLANSSGKDQEKCKELSNLSQKEFNKQWLNYRGFYGDDIVDRLEEIIKEEC